jgi:peptidyl-prolyl cis-trans isomerase D
MAGATLVVSRAQPRDLPPALLDVVLKAATTILPAVVGVPLGNEGYAVARISKVSGRDPIAADPVKAQTQYAQVWADAEAAAYYAALKSRYKVSVNEAAMAAREGAASEPR